MYAEIIKNISGGALNKFKIYDSSKIKYIISSMLAGFFVGLGLISMGASISVFGGLDFPVVKFTNGFIFSLALSLVIMAGGDLFTGNVLVLSTGAMTKTIRTSDAIKVCALSYIGNFLGALLVSFLYMGTGIKDSGVCNAIIELAKVKASFAFVPMIFKGIMCNILVCLAVLCCIKMKSESAKLIMVFWCIMPFVILGFEHSIANMTCFIIAKAMSPEITIAMIMNNLVPSTIGNIIGGLLVAGGYYFLGRE
ncbi:MULTISPECIES: formate/nitrite transporter family protein [Peptoniphilus]|uniref:formate/nitrite transporter family protein n=1 Tax=Peptoniphilus TaxID=162289 RepID=UPI0001DA99D9|nr:MULTISPECIES: formate/nitrite transporter family protein [Peptoniphilus]EFI41779.1 formate/nitrite transporter [Peptoniphilus sp. oral taxon 386 str. F0131]